MKSERRTRFAVATECATILFSLAWMLLAPLAVYAANFYAGTSPTNVPWPGGIVPYEFTNKLTAAETNTYLDGLREWELAGNVKFVPHTNQPNWILFTYNTNFIDYAAGGSHSPQVITISSLSRAQVCHEMGHSFGFNHENIRTDAPNYILVLTNNITDEPDNLHWFVPDPTTVPYGNYDFESVMHLGWDFDSTNPGVLATQQPKPPYFPRYQFRMGNYCLSPGDRAALAYLYPPAVTLTNIVTTTADVGPDSLRAAIYYATDHPGTTVRFDIPTSDPGYSNGVFNIHLTGMLPPLVTDGTVIDGSTQPGFAGKPLIFVDASQILPETFTSDTFLIYSANNQIKNIAFSGFDWNGMTLIYADATNNTISGCWFGLDYTGTNAAPNAYQGIYIAAGASRNIIGGTNALERNVISGNAQYGVYLTDSNTTGNIVLDNYIGMDFSGSNAVPNGLSGVYIVNGSSGNTVGGTNASARNVLSGNAQYGVFIIDSNTTGNVVLGNYIGTDASGSNALANGYGGLLIGNGASGNTVGGSSAFARNIISANVSAGIWVTDPGTTGNTIQGNWIGLNAAGEALPNTFLGMYLVNGAQSNLVLNNVFSGHYSEGLRISDPGTSFNMVQGNYFGTDPGGTVAIPNGYAGVNIQNGANSNLIGGAAVASRNLISGNYYNLVIDGGGGLGTSGNLVEGNYIGTDITGTNGLGYTWWNVWVQNGATSNSIGGTAIGAGNVIAFAASVGVLVSDTNTIDNSIRGNSIFGNSFLGIDLNNDGVSPNHIGFLAGPNDLQNYPVITNAYGSGTTTVIAGTLNSLANNTYAIDVYRNLSPNYSGYGEGQFYLGSLSATTDGSGNATFAYTNTAANYSGQYIAATATSAGGDTSEFSADVLATNVPVASAQFIGPYQSRTNGFAFSLNLETNFSYRIQTATNLAAPITWTDLTNFTATNSPFSFVDHSATNYRVRFYRVVSP